MSVDWWLMTTHFDLCVCAGHGVFVVFLLDLSITLGAQGGLGVGLRGIRQTMLMLR